MTTQPPAVDPAERWRDRLDPRLVHAMIPFVRALNHLHPTRFDGLDLLPKGPCLLVGNHGLLGYEAMFFFERIHAATGRIPRGLADRWFFRVPVMRDVLVRCGGMYGDPRCAHDVLTRGDMVVCYPGGAREVLKTDPDSCYRLLWGKSLGFIKVALRAGVPVVPFAAAGVDDTYTIVSRLKGSGKLLMGHDKYDLPVLRGLLGPLPEPVPFWFRIGDPIHLGHGPESVDDTRVVTMLRDRVWHRAQALLDGVVHDWRRTHRTVEQTDSFVPRTTHLPAAREAYAP